MDYTSDEKMHTAAKRPHVKHLQGSYITQNVNHDESPEGSSNKNGFGWSSCEDQSLKHCNVIQEMGKSHENRGPHLKLTFDGEKIAKSCFDESDDSDVEMGVCKFGEKNNSNKYSKFYDFKQKDSFDDKFFALDMRTRTCSMPTRNTLRKPHIQEIRRSHMCLHSAHDLGGYHKRSFEINAKGVLLKGNDDKAKSSNSLYCSEESLHKSAYFSRGSSSHSGESTEYNTSPVTQLAYKVIVSGSIGVGKTALTQQFMTSEYLGGFDTSFDGETEKTVNVLLNGEETALSFIEQSELDDADDLTDSTAAYVIVYACDDKISFDRAVDTLYNLRQKQHRDDVIFFVGNKSDLVRSRCVTADEAKAVAMTYNCKFVETSVVLNVHVDELLVGIVKQLRIRSDGESNKSMGCASTSLSLLNKIFKKDSLSKSCENLYA